MDTGIGVVVSDMLRTTGLPVLALSHINDAGYWIFTKLSGLNVADALRTWTVMTTLLGTLGFCITLLIWPFV